MTEEPRLLLSDGKVFLGKGIDQAHGGDGISVEDSGPGIFLDLFFDKVVLVLGVGQVHQLDIQALALVAQHIFFIAGLVGPDKGLGQVDDLVRGPEVVFQIVFLGSEALFKGPKVLGLGSSKAIDRLVVVSH